MTTAHYQATADILDGWRDDVLSGTPPTLYPVGTGELARIEIGPGLVTLIGGAPNAGKSALVMQWGLDALMLTPSLRAIVCSVEMSPSTWLDRQLARLSGIDLTAIRYRRLTTAHGDADRTGDGEPRRPERPARLHPAAVRPAQPRRIGRCGP
jgi:replicative DNA helicase